MLRAREMQAAAMLNARFHLPSPISPDVTGTKVPKTSTTAPPVDQVRTEEDVTIETLPESLKLQGPSRGLCPAQTSGSPMTLKPALAAASASGDVQKLEEVETSPRAFGAPDIAASTPTSKHPKHAKDRRFPDLLRATSVPGTVPKPGGKKARSPGTRGMARVRRAQTVRDSALSP